MAYLILILAVLSRVLPRLLHITGGNVTTVGASLLFFGAALSSRNRWHTVYAVAALAVTDWWLTVYGYGYAFHLNGYLITWLWYAGVCLAASVTLHGRHRWISVGFAALASSTSFFVLSNLAVFLRSGMYPHTTEGLIACYSAAVPFYQNDLLSTLAFAGLFFLLPVTESIPGTADASFRRAA